jgi:cobalt/nickel transport protein
MRTTLAVGLTASIIPLALVEHATAHFLVLLPHDDVIAADGRRTVNLRILFTHPMDQGPVMELRKPRRFGTLQAGQPLDLLGTLSEQKVDGKTAYTAEVKLARPGDYVFYVEPAPYWEPAERKWIVHYTKVVVDFLGAESGWDAMVGFPVEIEPLARPYGLWTGNTFRGIVKRDGRPVPFATVEIEYYNEGRRVRPPNDAFITQVVKADAQGVFAYTMPRAGWWGFAALVDGQKRDGPDGRPADVELGGLLWVKTCDMK